MSSPALEPALEPVLEPVLKAVATQELNIEKIENKSINEIMQESVNMAKNLNEEMLKKPFKVSGFTNDKQSSNDKQFSNYKQSLNYKQSVPKILYSVSDVEKQIKYFNSCAYYEYAGALSKYLGLLILYVNKENNYIPKYPSLCEYQLVQNVNYNRPLMYQGAGRT
jgi:hypothetical protein